MSSRREVRLPAFFSAFSANKIKEIVGDYYFKVQVMNPSNKILYTDKYESEVALNQEHVT